MNKGLNLRKMQTWINFVVYKSMFILSLIYKKKLSIKTVRLVNILILTISAFN